MYRLAAPVALALAAWMASSAASAQYGETGEGLATPPPPAEPRGGEPTQEPAPPPPEPDRPYTAPDPSQRVPSSEPGRYPEAPKTAELGEGQADGAQAAHIPSRVATRLRVLESDLHLLATRGGNSIVDGVLSVLAGGLSITFGVLANDGGSADDQRFARYLFLWGSGQIARGIVDFSIPLHADEASIEFQHMPMGTPEQVRTRLQFGEDALERIARRSRIARLLDASLNVGVGLAAIPVYLARGSFEIDTPEDWFVVFASGVSVITGVVNFILKSDAEKRWNAYTKLRGRLEQESRQEEESRAQSEAGIRWQVGAGPVRGGGAALVQGRF